MLQRRRSRGIGAFLLLAGALFASCDNQAIEPDPTPAVQVRPTALSVAPEWVKFTRPDDPPFQSDLLTPFGGDTSQTFVVNGPPLATGDVTFKFKSTADLNGNNRFVTVFGNNAELATLFNGNGAFDCNVPASEVQFTMSAAEFNDLLELNGNLRIDLVASPNVSETDCTPFSFIMIRIEYCGGPDCNGNGTSDSCDIQNGTSFDTNNNGSPDECDLRVDSINPSSGPIEGGTVISIEGDGFINGTSVLFGEQVAAEIQVINPGLITAVSPQGGAGAVDIVVSKHDGAKLTEALPNAFTYVFIPEDDGTDTDNDGRTDVEELRGYEIAIDLFGFGFGNNGGNLVRRTVFSDPTTKDTDDDGLDDFSEWIIASDARDSDTDRDGWSDSREAFQELTSPVSVDTDGDARGPDGTLPPNASLFDRTETEEVFVNGRLFYGGTSPILDDTDGDGVTDYDEFANPIRSPLIADVPQVKVDFVGDLTLTLDISLAEGTSVTEGEQYGLTESESSSTTESNESTWENSLEFTESLELSASYEFGLLGGATIGATVGFSATQGFTEGGSTGWSEESSEEVQNSFLEIQEESFTQEQTVNGGSVTAGVKIINQGNVAFTLRNLLLSALVIDQTARDGFRPIAALRPAVDDVTLSAFDETGVLTVQTDVGTIGAQQILALLEDPSGLIIDIATFDLVDAEGRSFAFLNDITNARTATVVLDQGLDRPVERYRVTTEVVRNADGTATGITVNDVLTKVLEIPFETQARTTSTDPNLPNGVTVLTKVRDRELTIDDRGTQDVTDDKALAFWAVFGTFDQAGDNSVNFEDIVLRASDTIMLVYTEDRDDDNVFKREEFLYGSSDEDTDSDDDTLDDFFEIRTGWDVFVLGDHPQFSGLKHVFPDPTRDNVDLDLVDDVAEMLGPDGFMPGDPMDTLDATDPKNPDTDGDGLLDGADNCPTDPGNQPPAINLTKSEDESGSEVTLTGTIAESLMDGRCDVDSIQTIEFDWGDGNVECFDLSDPQCGDLLTFDLENDLDAKSIQVSIAHVYATQEVDFITATATDVRGALDVETFEVDITFPVAGLLAFYPMNDEAVVNNVVRDNGPDMRNGTRDSKTNDTINRFGEASGAFCFERQVIKSSGAGTVTLPNIPAPGSGGMTMAMWVVSGNNGMFIAGQQNFLALYLNDSNRIEFTIKDGSNTYQSILDPNAVPTHLANDKGSCGEEAVISEWTFYAATVRIENDDGMGNPIPTQSRIRLYRGDGANLGMAGQSLVTLINEVIVSGAITNPNLSQGWQIAGEMDSFGPVVGTNDPSGAYSGRVDDLRVYDRALAEIEVNALFNEADNSSLPGN